MKRNYILHPFLFVIYAVLAPLSANIGVVGVLAIRSLVTYILLAVTLSVILRLVLKDQQQSGLLLSGMIVYFLSFGHVDALVANYISWNGASLVLLIIYTLLLSLWVFFVLKKSVLLPTFTNYFNLVGIILIIFPLYNILTYSRHPRLAPIASEYKQYIWQESGVSDFHSSIAPDQRTKPDIYYIILDSYTSADVLRDLFGYDNSGFIQELEARGFYVAKESRSNYADTIFSVSSALNLSHVNTLPDYLRPNMEVTDRNLLLDSLSFQVKQNKASSFLAEQGYSFVNFATTYERINIQSADYFEKPPSISSFNPQEAFDLILLNTTMGKAYFRLRGEENGPFQTLFDNHRARILYTLDNLDKFADQDGSYFTYVHIIAPHAPYVFGPNGEERKGADPFTLLEDVIGEEWSPDLYRDQVIFINKMILEVIDNILAKSDPKPIIILQADHGNRNYNVVEPSGELEMKLNYSILNAYLFPGYEEKSPVYPTITPVNSFRLMFNTYFGTRLKLLEDTSYVLTDKHGRLEFVEACLEYKTCSP